MLTNITNNGVVLFRTNISMKVGSSRFFLYTSRLTRGLYDRQFDILRRIPHPEDSVGIDS